VGYTEHAENRPTFFANHLFFLMGMQWVTLATNLVEFFIAWEIMLVPTYFLILFWGVPETRTRTAIKFWLYTQAGAVTILIGFGMIAYLVSVQTGTLTLDMQVIQTVVPALTGSLTTLKVIYVLLAAGFLVKMAVFPLHWWLPPVHAEAPTPISVLLSGAMIETGAYAMVRFNTIILSSVAIDLSFWVAMLGVLTMFYGGIMALAQRDIKRLLAYSSVSQMGYVLFAIGVFTVSGVTGGLFHLVSHALSKGLLFMCAGAVIHQTQLRDIGAMGGLSNKMPVTAFAAAVGAMSIAGSPPLAGFASEWLMFLGGFHAYESTGNTPFLVLSVVAISSIILSASYMLRFFTTVFLGPHPEDLEEVHEAPRSMTLSMTVLAVLTLIFGVFPALAVDVIKPLVEIISGILPWR
ncbi:MAG: NADH-quinone oxidoreductase subunit M, partial [Candidatus Thorarchaeota archaeon]